MAQNEEIVALFSQLPLPEFAGDRQMINNHLKILSSRYNVHAIIICIEEPTKEVHDFMKRYTKEYTIFHLKKWEICRNIIKGVLFGKSLQVSLYYQNNIQKYIDKCVEDKNFVFCRTIRTSTYFLKHKTPKFISLVDSISINYERSIKKVDSFIWKMVYLYEYNKIRKEEIEVIEKYDASFLINYQEQQYFKGKVKDGKVVWLPNGIKEHLFDYDKIDYQYTDNTILFLGKMDYQPNIDAVIWFIDKVMDKLDKDIKFYVVGVNPDKKIKQRAEKNKNLIVTGYIEDPYLLMNSCTLVVSPMQTGGGVQNKILEGMAMKKLNLATSLGAESIYLAEKDKHILIADQPSEMASLINEVCKTPSKFSHIGVNAQLLVKDIYSWEKHGIKMIETIEDCFKQSSDQT